MLQHCIAMKRQRRKTAAGDDDEEFYDAQVIWTL